MAAVPRLLRSGRTKRRWRVTDDIPWDQCNPHLKPVVADVVETFCAVELYLPDYSARSCPSVRHSKGRTWFYANWGYEESKHSLALGDWLLKSGHRPKSTWPTWRRRSSRASGTCRRTTISACSSTRWCRRKRRSSTTATCSERGQDAGRRPGALEKMLGFLAIDEKAHHTFFRDCLKLYLEYDRAAVIEQLRRVMNDFQMPAIHDLLDESRRRIAAIRELEICSTRTSTTAKSTCRSSSRWDVIAAGVADRRSRKRSHFAWPDRSDSA